MYSNYTPDDGVASEDDPHEPTNVPDGLEERCHRLFEHTETWSARSGATTFVYPKTEPGYDDYALMLDEMGFEAGAIHRFRDARLFTISRDDVRVKWGEKYSVDDGGVTLLRWDGDDDGKKIRFTPGEGYSPDSLWKAFIYGDLERVGHVTDC